MMSRVRLYRVRMSNDEAVRVAAATRIQRSWRNTRKGHLNNLHMTAHSRWEDATIHARLAVGMFQFSPSSVS
jgi:hypothetical protein